jgi:hypothetical protein
MVTIMRSLSIGVARELGVVVGDIYDSGIDAVGDF